MSRTYRLSEEERRRRAERLRRPDLRAKMSAARKAALADPAVRAKMSAASKAAWADPAVRAKMSAARKAAWARKNPDLAALTSEQYAVYKKLRAKGCTRSEAVREAARPRIKRAA